MIQVLLIGAVVLFFVGAFLHIMPSRNDRKRAALRTQAMARGLQPRLIVSPEVSPFQHQHVYEYRCARAWPVAWKLARVASKNGWEMRATDTIQRAIDMRTLTPLLARLPSVLAHIEMVGPSIRFVWHDEVQAEPNDLATLVDIAEELERQQDSV